jgi:hypothetical protein
MNFQVFSDEFIKKWLREQDRLELNSLNDRKLKAGINWMEAITKSAFKRYDIIWEKLKHECLKCMEENCVRDYNWILENSIKHDDELTKTSTEYKTISFKNAELGKEGHQRVNKYHSCKENCYEKVNLMNQILSNVYTKTAYDFNMCFVYCRAKSIDRDTQLADCYSDCMVKFSYIYASHEYYITYSYDKMMKEYSLKQLDTPKVDLNHIFRIKQREFTPDLWSKYI